MTQNLNLAYLQPKTQLFVELLLITVILHGQRASTTKREEKVLMATFLKDSMHIRVNIVSKRFPLRVLKESAF